jgi:diguanylate cyclase (GGDEF)-like protein
LAYAVLDDSLSLLTMSPNLEALLGMPRIVIGRPVTEGLDALVGSEPELQRVLDGTVGEYRLEYRNVAGEDGSNTWLTLNLWPHEIGPGRLGLLLVVEEVTSSARNEQRSMQARNELRLTRTQLDLANKELQRQALFDELTGLPNRRYLDAELQRYVGLANENATALTAILIDVDDFKALNDNHGHLEGDRCLRVLASAIRGSMRATDFAARYGGDECCVFVPMADATQTLARRIRASISEQNGHTETPFTISIGVAIRSAAQGQFSETDLLKAADAALYRAKRDGKNRIVVATSDEI